MTQQHSLAEEAEVAAKRRLVAEEGTGHRPELAKALLELSCAYEQGDRMEDALATARESVATLSPGFFADPRRFAAPMRALVAQYMALVQRSGARADEALLAPVAQALGNLTRAEDEAEDANG
jgi:hypothetical protein